MLRLRAHRPIAESLREAGPALLLAAAALNGFAVRVIDALNEGASTGLLPGVSPFELLVVLIALPLVAAPAAGEPWRLGWREVVTSLLLLVPSSAVAWVAVALYASLIARVSTGKRRYGAVLFLGLAVSAIWSSIFLKMLAEPATTLEAALVEMVASQLVPDLVRTGNVIGVPAGHHLVLLTACTSADALPRALLAVVALAHFAGATDARRILKAAAAGGMLLVAANTLRLALMTLSASHYAEVHGPVGAGLYDALQVMIVVSAAFWASRA